MARVKIYKEGEHKAGFIGAAVRTKIDGEHVQRYFSFKQMTERRARREAKAFAAEISDLQTECYEWRYFERKKFTSNAGFKTIIQVHNITTHLSSRGPQIKYVLYGKKQNRAAASRQRKFLDEQTFIEAYRDCCIKRAHTELDAYHKEWIEYWESLRPSWAMVKRYYFKRYQFGDWVKPKR